MRRVYRTSVIVYAVVAVYTLAYAGVTAWVGLTAGVALALASLRLIEWSVKTVLVSPAAERDEEDSAPRVAGRPARSRAKAILTLIAGAKYGVLGLIVAGAVWLAGTGGLSLPAFVGGIALVHAVIALKAVGAWLVGPTKAREKSISRKTG
jgi:hypothetical protein